MPSLNNYPPGVTGNEPQIAGYDEEDLYLVCDDCGEAFDSLEMAYEHNECPSYPVFQLLPESEAL